MKYLLIALLALASPMCTSAQLHNLYADIGVPFPGFSATYSYKFAKHWGIGGGVQGYPFYPTGLRIRKFTPAVYGDVRLYIRPEKNNQFFSFMDLGMNFYKFDDRYYRDSTVIYDVRNNGVYSGLGFGYFRRMTERGGGPYASMKLVLNWHTLYGYSIVSEEQEVGLLEFSGTFAFSLGYKF